MDPLSALSLSCNILDLIEKAVKCSLLVKKLHDGTPMGIGEDAETIYDTMQEVITALGDKNGRPLLKPRLQTSMDNILAHCEELSRALEKVLCKCKPGRKSSWRAAGAAIIRIMISKSDIEGLVGKLKEQRTALGMLELEIIRDSTENINRQLDHVNLTENRILVQLDDVGTKVETSIQPLREKVDEVLSKLKESDGKVKRQLIIRSLEFATMDERLDDIHDPAKDTFSWIFDNPERLKKEKTLKINLTDWLQHGSGIFHIVGKAGSGKSTLMKFIYEMPQTAELLQKWAQLESKQMVICQFFLWRVTSVKEKKTLKGLIRGLLHNILSQVPELSSILFPRLWQQKLSAFDGNTSFRITDREVATAFETLMESKGIFDKLRIRLCFLIDGLDEFEEVVVLQRETSQDLAMKLQKWAYNSSHNHIKICVTSRPLPEFMSVFGINQRMTLEKHTKADIRKFVHDELEANELFQALGRTSRVSNVDCGSILRRVIDRANGVSLWVVLITQVLKQELSIGGSAQSLLNIVASSNPILNVFFEQIIHSIPYHHRLASFYFLAASMHLLGYYINPEDNLRLFHNLPEQGRPRVAPARLDLWDSARVFELAEKNPQDFLKFDEHTNIPEVDEYEHEPESAIMHQKRLASRCRGLVELNKHMKLVFIHRSIPEVLQEYFRQEKQPRVEDKKVSEMLAWITLARATSNRLAGPDLQRYAVIRIFDHLRLRDLDGCESIFRILQHIDAVLIHSQEQCDSKRSPWIRLHKQKDELDLSGSVIVPYLSQWWFRSWPDIISLCQQCGIHEYACWGLKEFLHRPEYRDRALRLLTDTILNSSLGGSLHCLAHRKIIDAMVSIGLNFKTLEGAAQNENDKTEAGALWYEFIGRELHFRATYYSKPTIRGFTERHIEFMDGYNWRGIEAFLRLGADADILLAQTHDVGSIVGPQGKILFTVSEDYYRSPDFKYSRPSLIKLPKSPISLRDFVAYQASHYDVPNSERLLELIDRSISEKASLVISLPRISFLKFPHNLGIFLLGVFLSLLVYRFGTWDNLGLAGFMV
ncbi:hypothetical protein PG985_014317 [Apiospora marii]|uniref:uncharacterized protein n=1 Tax=Apiospora marii TaxID=335849 RepID=UPI00312F3C99